MHHLLPFFIRSAFLAPRTISAFRRGAPVDSFPVSVSCGILNEKAGVFAVCAPAGYGKTSLLSGWAEQTNAKICWLSLDFDANNYHRFRTYMITAFSLAYKKHPTEQLLRELNEKTSQEFIMAFLNLLASNTVIILTIFIMYTTAKSSPLYRLYAVNFPQTASLLLAVAISFPFHLLSFTHSGAFTLFQKRTSSFLCWKLQKQQE